VVPVEDLLGPSSRERAFSGSLPVTLDLVEVVVDDEMVVDGVLKGGIDSVELQLNASVPAHFTCVRCLTEWDAPVVIEVRHHLGLVEDEDGYPITDGMVDVGQPAIDEISLAIPPAPLCRPGCRGLCPICGNDLNSDPCDGHGDESDSPFAVLKDLFDS